MTSKKKIPVTIYYISGNHRLFVIPDKVCEECDLTISTVKSVIKKLGEKRSREGAYVWRSLIDSGTIIPNGTDSPVESINPFENFYAAVTRKMSNGESFYPGQVMSREEALSSYTINPAYAAFEEETKGTLKIGKLADIVVLSQNILIIPEEKIPETEVVYTIVGGKILYQK